MKNVAIYARVSTHEQDPDMQLMALRDYAKKRDFHIFNEYVDIISGKTETRENYDRLFANVRKRKIDIVLVWRFDRFARSTKALIIALDEFSGLGVDFISYQENIDTTSPLGRAVFTIIAAIAEFEKDMIVQRVKAGLEKAKSKGQQLGRRPITEDQQTTIHSLRSKGLSIRQIAKKEKLSVGVVSKYLKVAA
ncbi:MAG: recombinase family protein [Candidatus Margulisbacteria bacterium]|nr:recombinase family protein [Candidatus Margulisiibacteriota bacterium]